jgi:hypothetical protein
MSAAVACILMLQLSSPAAADPAIWVNAKWVKATYTNCGGRHYLVLRGNAVKAPAPSKESGCVTSEEIFHQLNLAKAFLPSGNNGQFSQALVDAGYIFCGKGEAAINLGTAREVASVSKISSIPGCTYTQRRYQSVSSLGGIAFTDVPNGGTMTVAESLAMHAKERQKIIADCDANPACRAELARMQSSSGPATPGNPCAPGRGYSNYNGSGRCTDNNGNPDPSGAFVTP